MTPTTLAPGERLRAIIQTTADVMNVPLAMLLMPTRGVHRIAQARHVAMYVAGTTVALPHADLAAAFGRARSSISVAVKAIGEQLATDAALRQQVELIASRTGGNLSPQGAQGAPNAEANSHG